MQDNKWYFSIIDIISVLTDSENPRKYWSVLKTRLKQEGNQTATNCSQLKLISQDGKFRLTDVANTEQIFRLIQSIPSKKVEPFKQWLAKVGYERIQEIENPELAQDRVRKIYSAKGYPNDWIDKRLRGIAVRQTLTNEWDNRGIKEDKEFAILTNEIAKATFGVSIKEHKRIKGLDLKNKNQNLRDHMDDLELIFSMLGEASTTRIVQKQNSQGFKENKIASKKGGKIAGDARIKLEIESGDKIISKENYLNIKKTKKLING